jgi:hypothetical protein
MDKTNTKPTDPQTEASSFIKTISSLPNQSPSLKSKLLLLNTFKNQIKQTQDNTISIQIRKLRIQYDISYISIFNKIGDIVKSTSLTESNALLTQNDNEVYKLTSTPEDNEITVKEIPCFWLDAIVNAAFFTVNKVDEEILSCLYDIKMNMNADTGDLTVMYYFKENDYMENTMLTKTYYYDISKGVFYKGKCDEMPKWKDEKKNPMKKIKVKKDKGNKKYKMFKQDSFFDMFHQSDDNKEEDESEGDFIRSNFITNILEYFLNFQDDSEDDEGY